MSFWQVLGAHRCSAKNRCVGSAMNLRLKPLAGLRTGKFSVRWWGQWRSRLGWLRAILRPGSTRKMTVLGTGRGRLYRIAQVARWASVQGDIGGCYGSLIRERMGLPDRPLTRPVGSTGNWWLAQQAARKASAGERASILIGGVTICRHGARQNQPPNQVNQGEAPLGSWAFTPPWIMGDRATGEARPVILNSLETSRRSAVGISPMPVAGTSKTLSLVHSVVSTIPIDRDAPWPSTSGGGKPRRAV